MPSAAVPSASIDLSCRVIGISIRLMPNAKIGRVLRSPSPTHHPRASWLIVSPWAIVGRAATPLCFAAPLHSTYGHQSGEALTRISFDVDF